MATLIGLCLRVKLMRSLPSRFKLSININPGTHASEKAVNKQLNDKVNKHTCCFFTSFWLFSHLLLFFISFVVFTSFSHRWFFDILFTSLLFHIFVFSRVCFVFLVCLFFSSSVFRSECKRRWRMRDC
jgi:hypothetical protein